MGEFPHALPSTIPHFLPLRDNKLPSQKWVQSHMESANPLCYSDNIDIHSILRF
jgi:hypothetical protein